MLNLNKLEVDIIEELPTSKNIEIKNKGNPRSKHKRKAEFGKISNKMRKRLNHVDSHHLESSVIIIQQNNLYKERVTKRLSDIPDLCSNCKNCIRSINYCAIFKMSCSKSGAEKTCSFKAYIENDKNK